MREEVEFEYPFHVVSRFGSNWTVCEIICYRGDGRSPRWIDEDPGTCILPPMHSPLIVNTGNFASLRTIVVDSSRIARVAQGGTSYDYYRQNHTVMTSLSPTEIKVYLTWVEKVRDRHSLYVRVP